MSLKSSSSKLQPLNFEHDCALKQGSNRCSGCELGIDGNGPIEMLRKKAEKSHIILEGLYSI